ncbi:DUF3226 domain-containing protein [Thiomicrorhabdus indica]|uniref:DUF3226 domain-containing protein n=1 Tax=Thiomicrorhabdus indica TaxID=2267253 RepID=UPI00102DD481|nr:DUF3226 domain-containing protein [Thiomicrorhabdus indica]
MSSLIIVESDNDKYFLLRLMNELGIEADINPPICDSTDFKCLSGLGNLDQAINEIRWDEYDKIGIMVDADSVGIEQRLQLVQESLVRCGVKNPPEAANQLSACAEKNVEIAICVLNVNGVGELETLLKEIKSENSIHADCLEAWKECLNNEGIKISQKEFDKFWISQYLRYDTCTSEERKQAGRKCNYESGINKDIWNLADSRVDHLRGFLNLLS